MKKLIIMFALLLGVVSMKAQSNDLQRYEKYRMRETVCPQIAKNSPMQLDDYFPNRKNYVYLCFGCC